MTEMHVTYPIFYSLTTDALYYSVNYYDRPVVNVAPNELMSYNGLCCLLVVNELYGLSCVVAINQGLFEHISTPSQHMTVIMSVVWHAWNNKNDGVMPVDYGVGSFKTQHHQRQTKQFIKIIININRTYLKWGESYGVNKELKRFGVFASYDWNACHIPFFYHKQSDTPMYHDKLWCHVGIQSRQPQTSSYHMTVLCCLPVVDRCK